MQLDSSLIKKLALITSIAVASILLIYYNSYLEDKSNEFAQILTARFEPSEIPGLRRTNEHIAVKISEQELTSVPKIQRMLDSALSSSNSPLIEYHHPLINDTLDPTKKYIISKPTVFTFQSDGYFTNGELESYTTWIENNLNSIPSGDNYKYYIEYKGEIFWLYWRDLDTAWWWEDPNTYSITLKS